MDVTLKLDEELSAAARDRADNAGTSLSNWITDLLKRELFRPAPRFEEETLLDLLGSDDAREMEFPRRNDLPRRVDFS